MSEKAKLRRRGTMVFPHIEALADANAPVPDDERWRRLSVLEEPLDALERSAQTPPDKTSA